MLAVLDGDPEPLTPTVIGERTLIAKTSVTSVLDSLERLGSGSAAAASVSRRSTLVELTATGRWTCAAILRGLHGREADGWHAMPQAAARVS